MKFEAVFIDRDGTLGGTGHFIHPQHFILYDGVQQSINQLKSLGIKVFAFTNQHRISKGEATIEAFKLQFTSYGFDDSFICPHSHDEDCNCRKPSPKMLLEAAAKYELNLSNCVVIGDVGSTDMIAANRAGTKKILVRTGWGEASLTSYRAKWKEVEPEYIAKDINDAIDWIVKMHTTI